MDILYFFNLLGKRKWFILLPAIAAAVATFFLVQQLPKKYKSAATLSTGIVDYKGITVGNDNTFVQQFQIESRFSNLTEDLISRPSVKIMSRSLLRHDLADPANAFHTPKWENSQMFDPATLQKFAKEYVTQTDSISDPLHMFLSSAKALELEKVFDYDYQKLAENLDVKRVGETDFVRIELTSDNPNLSYYAVSNYTKDYLNSFYTDDASLENNSVTFYTELSVQKKFYLDSLVDVLNAYKQNRLLVNLEDQGKGVVMQLQELEIAREQERKNIMGYGQAIANLDKQIGSVNREVNNENFARNVYMKSDVQELGNQIQALNQQYVSGGMKDEGLRRRADELRTKREGLAKQYAITTRDKDDLMGDVSKDWLRDKVALENKNMIAGEGVKSLEREINRLRSLKSSLVSSNSYVGNLEQEVILAQDDYTHTAQKLEQAKLNYQDQERPLRIIELPLLAAKAESNKAILLSAFAGVASAVLASILIFLLAFFDTSLNTPYQFKKFTRLPLLGMVNRLPSKLKDLNFIFNSAANSKETDFFKETVRRLRLEIEESGGKVFLFASPKPQVGKSFLIVALAYALGLKEKKVLIIDTNFKNNTLTLFANGSAFGQALNSKPESSTSNLSTGSGLSINAKLYNVDIIGNKQGSQSPSEILNGTSFGQQLETFKQRYDYIFMEAAAMNRFSDARELAMYADKIIPVFLAENKLTAADEDALTYLKNQNGKMLGGVLNCISLKLVHS